MQRSKDEIVAAYNRQVGADAQRVAITGTDMSFEDMVVHQIKWAAATIVAAIVVAIPFAAIYLLHKYW